MANANAVSTIPAPIPTPAPIAVVLTCPPSVLLVLLSTVEGGAVGAIDGDVSDVDEVDEVCDVDDVDDVVSLEEVDTGRSEDDVLVLEVSLDASAEVVATASIVDTVELASLDSLLIQNCPV